MKEKFVCPRCGNQEERYIGYHNGIPYCRRCLSFSGRSVDITHSIQQGITLNLSYPLSEKQERVAKETLSLLKRGKNVLIHAVTGAGKTELVYDSMAYYLGLGLHVGFATPRKDVVVDLKPRIEEAFPKAKVISVFGEHSEILQGDIITLTTHQLYRYENYFDLLVLDEIDAFPYKDNPVLKSFFRKSVRGNYILLSATPSKEDIQEIKKDNGMVLTLFERYHKNPLPLPEYIHCYSFQYYFKVLSLLRKYENENKPVFIFTPTIEEGKKLFRFLSLFYSDGEFVSSQEEERRSNIERFKNGELTYLVTTSILERGVTVKDLQVIVYKADHILFTQAALVQIAGRAGRKIQAPKGDVIFLASERSTSIDGAIKEIQRYNKQRNLL